MHFAKPTPANPVPSDLVDLIDHALHDAKQAVDPADRTVEVTLGDVPAVVVDTKQVTMAVTEVLSNALQATNEKSGHVQVHAAFDPYSMRVVLTVADNGCGMEESTLKRAFDPFFSQRKAGRRRGMGLAKAMRWLEASGGSIRLESRPDAGTRALILLPAANAAAEGNAIEKQRKGREVSG
jgi:signal transduction histidine kinase